MGSLTSASHYVTSASRYQSRSSMYIRGLIPLNSTELTEIFPIGAIISIISSSVIILQRKRELIPLLSNGAMVWSMVCDLQRLSQFSKK